MHLQKETASRLLWLKQCFASRWLWFWAGVNLALPLLHNLLTTLWDYSIHAHFMQGWMFFVLMNIANLLAALPLPNWKAPIMWRGVFLLTLLTLMLNAASFYYFSDMAFWQCSTFIYYSRFS